MCCHLGLYLALGSSGVALLPCSQVSTRGDTVHPKSLAAQRNRLGSAATVSRFLQYRSHTSNSPASNQDERYALHSIVALFPGETAEMDR